MANEARGEMITEISRSGDSRADVRGFIIMAHGWYESRVVESHSRKFTQSSRGCSSLLKIILYSLPSSRT